MDYSELGLKAEEATDLLKSLSNEKRLMIVCVLAKNEHCVGDLEDMIELSQSALSQHLARLRRDGIVKTRRDAQTIFYSLRDPRIGCILKCLNGIFVEDDDDGHSMMH